MNIRWTKLILGPAKDPLNPKVFHTITLAAFFAWVGLGADGLSSSCYGPEEAFLALKGHPFLALPLALFVGLTVFVISASYSQIIELFPSGGGGYMVATKLLGRGPGVVCGSALILDYILTIAISVSSGVNAIFSSVPTLFTAMTEDRSSQLANWKPYVAIAMIGMLILLNLRGVKESIFILLPIFLTFLFTHLVGILWAILGHSGEVPALAAKAAREIGDGAAREGGWLALLAVFFAAYSKGAGTYTGIEAVSNSMQILREPRAATGRRTMLYMAISLAFTAAGLLVGYLLLDVENLLLDVEKVKGKTLNAVFFERVFSPWNLQGFPLGDWLIVITLLSEGALLFVAAQAGFIGGPRTLATMAHDRWVPTRFSHLSNRLVIQDGVLFMGVAAALFVLFTKADVKVLVVLYSINVFLTFTLAQLGMCFHWLRTRPKGVRWRRKLSINGLGLVLCILILVLMVYFKFALGGWVTILLTGATVVCCYLVHGHYEKVRRCLRDLDKLEDISHPPVAGPPPALTPNAPTAVILVSGFNGLGMHSFLTVLRMFPNHFKNFIFLSVGVVDFEEFKDPGEIEKLRSRTMESLEKYTGKAAGMGLYAEHLHGFGTDLAEEVEKIAKDLVRKFPGSIFFAGQLVFEEENILTHSLHSQAAFEIQRRLQFSGVPLVLLPVRMRPDAAR